MHFADPAALNLSLAPTLDVFEHVFENTPLGMALLDVNGQIRWANQTLAEIHHCRRRDLRGCSMLESPDSAAQAKEMAIWEELVAGHVEKIHLERRVVTDEGHVVWVSCHVGPLELEQSPEPLFLLQAEDISVRRRAEDEHRSTNERIRHLIKVSPTVLYACDPQPPNRPTYVSENVLELLGWPPEKFTEGCGFWKSNVHPDDLEETLERIPEAHSGLRTDLEYRFRHRDGSWRWIRDEPKLITDEHGNVQELVGCWQDVTEQYEFREKLKSSEAEYKKLSLVASSTDNAVIITDPKGRIEWVNEGFTRITEYTLEDALGQVPGSLLQGPESDLDEIVKMRAALEKGQGFKAELINYTKSRRPYWVSIHVQPIHDDDGNIINWIGLELDMTERKEWEQQLHLANIEARRNTLLAQKMAEEARQAAKAKSDFLANMSHEIRTPMNGIIGMTSLILDTQLSDEQRESAQTVQKCGEHLLALINDILDFSKIEAGMMELEEIDFDLRAMVDDIMDILGHAVRSKGLDLIGLVNAEVPSMLRGDPSRLRQVLINLLNNAVKFTDEGEVMIEVETKEENDDTVELIFKVKDSGIGIPPDRMNRLFKSFSQVDASTTRKYGGTGLGLAICKELSELMGGQIGVESVEGEGSTFWFTAKLGRQAQGEHFDPSLEILRDRRVLVVEPNESHRRALLNSLTRWEMKPTIASDVNSAFATVREAAARGENFEVVVASEGIAQIDGPAIARRIKSEEALKGTAMVLLAAAGHRGEAKRMEELGFAGYLTKPIKQSQLRGCLALVLGEHRDSKGGQALITRHTVSESRKRQLRILLAEDNRVNQKVALKLLDRLGYSAEAFDNGALALEALKSKPYDIVLTDVQMPEMDGYELTLAIRSTKSDLAKIPIIAMTANAMEGDRKTCLDIGMDDYISKPVKSEDLKRVLEEWGFREEEDNDSEVEITEKTES